MDRKIVGGAAYPIHIVGVAGLETPQAGGRLPVSIEAEAYVVGVAGDINAPAVNTAAVVTYAAAAGLRNIITGIAWSYEGGVPVGGNLQVTDAGVVIFTVDIVEEGPGVIAFPIPKAAGINSVVVITLTAGGATITGKVSILNHYQEA